MQKKRVFKNRILKKLRQGRNVRANRYVCPWAGEVDDVTRLRDRDALCGYRAAERGTDAALAVKATALGDWEDGVRVYRRVRKERALAAQSAI